MSASPFFQSAGRGDLLFWGKTQGPTVLTWESISEQQKASWLEEIKTMHDWVVWCKSQKGREEIRSFELSRKRSSLTITKQNLQRCKKKRRGAKKVHIREQKECISQTERSIQVMVETGQHQNGSERGAVMQCFCTHALFVYGVTLITQVPPLLPSAAIPR